jgi:hypothetical protein
MRLMGMTASSLPYDPSQTLRLPPALQEWLPQGHLAYYMSDTVGALHPNELAALFVQMVLA